MREWLETRLVLPFLPFAFDLFLRFLALRDQLKWWQIPDVKTLTITISFFCLLLALDLKGVGKIPSENEYRISLDSLRKRFALQGTFFAIIFGISVAIDVAEISLNDERLSILLKPPLLILCLIFLPFSIIDSVFANYRYKLSYSV